MFLKTFFLMHDLFTFIMRNNKDMPIDVALNLMGFLGYQLKYFKGYALDIEHFVRTMMEIYGNHEALDFIRDKKDKLMWQAEEKAELD